MSQQVPLVLKFATGGKDGMHLVSAAPLIPQPDNTKTYFDFSQDVRIEADAGTQVSLTTLGLAPTLPGYSLNLWVSGHYEGNCVNIAGNWHFTNPTTGYSETIPLVQDGCFVSAIYDTAGGFL